MCKNKLVKIRNRKMSAQKGCCFYCNQPMWTERFSHYCEKHKLSHKQAVSFQCTAEHLLARSDGGKDIATNIVAACKFCNQTRHRAQSPLNPAEYLKRVSARVSIGKWHAKFPS